MTIKLRFLKFALIFYFLFSGFLFAEESESIDLSDQRIIKIETYLNNIKYLKANFIQDDITNSQLSEGIFYMFRPGKLRIDYTNPFEASLYTNNKITTYYDKELDEISNIRTKSTPLHFLLNDNLSFSDKSILVTNFSEDKKFYNISLKELKKQKQGTLILKFKKNPFELNSIKLINELDQEVEMSLFKISTDEIDKSVFVFKNPRN